MTPADETVVQCVTPARHLDDLDTIKAAQAEHLEALKSFHTIDSLVRLSCGIGLTQKLVDEAGLRLEYERIGQVRDRYSPERPPGPLVEDPRLPPWLVIRPQIDPAVVAVQDRIDIPEDWTSVADVGLWYHLRTRVRAWAVNGLIRELLERAPEHAGKVQQRDLVDAANGDREALERLLSFLTPSTDIAPAQATRNESDAPTGRDADIIRRWNSPQTAKQIGENLGLATKTIRNEIGRLRKLYGTDVVPHRRKGF